MSRICDVTGKTNQVGMQVSHAMNHTKKVFAPNLHKKRFFVPGENRWVKLKVSNAGLRYIAKNGIHAALRQAAKIAKLGK